MQLVLMVAAVVVDKLANHQQFVQFVPFVPTINNLCPPGMIRKSLVVIWQLERRKRAAGGDRHRHQHQKSAKSATTTKTTIIRTISQQQSRKPVSFEPKVSRVTSQQTYKSPAVAANSSCRSCVINVHWTLCSSSILLECMTLSKKQRYSWPAFQLIHSPNFIFSDKSR